MVKPFVDIKFNILKVELLVDINGMFVLLQVAANSKS